MHLLLMSVPVCDCCIIYMLVCDVSLCANCNLLLTISLSVCLSVSQRNITRTFDLKGSSRARYVDLGHKVESFDEVRAKTVVTYTFYTF